MSLLKELIESEQEQIEALPLMEALEESVRNLNMQSAGGTVKNLGKGVGQWIKKNPGLAVGAAALAVNAFGQYQKNKRNMIKLHGKTSHEKEMMGDIVNKLTSGGQWKIHKVKFEGGGKSWELVRKWKS